MVILGLDAVVTYATMVRTWRAPDITAFANELKVIVFNKELKLLIFFV